MNPAELQQALRKTIAKLVHDNSVLKQENQTLLFENENLKKELELRQSKRISNNGGQIKSLDFSMESESIGSSEARNVPSENINQIPIKHTALHSPAKRKVEEVVLDACAEFSLASSPSQNTRSKTANRSD